MITNKIFTSNYFDSPKFSKCIIKYKSDFANGPSFKEFLEHEASSSNYYAGSIKKEKGKRTPLPPWLKTKIPTGSGYFNIENLLKNKKLATVCQEAKCPNIDECWNDKPDVVKTATIMVLGDTCTRACRFCSVKTAKIPPPPNPDEPSDVAEAVQSWNVGYIVVTTVDRDDLPDGGSSHLASTVVKLKERVPDILVECLTSDYQGVDDHINLVALSGLDVFAHNIETVERLQRLARDVRANYKQSLSVLEKAKLFNSKLITKSSIMVGLGETYDEVVTTMKDLRTAGVDCLTIGQYMQPTKMNIKVEEYVHPDTFKNLEKAGLDMGFLYVASGPLVRSSYRAGELYMSKIVKNKTN